MEAQSLSCWLTACAATPCSLLGNWQQSCARIALWSPAECAEGKPRMAAAVLLVAGVHPVAVEVQGQQRAAVQLSVVGIRQ